jgi:hypothetical protein
MKKKKIIYEISEADIQDVAKRMFDRKLRKYDFKKVSTKLGDFINCFEAIENTIKK